MKNKIIHWIAIIASMSFSGCDTWKDTPSDLIHTITITNHAPCSISVTLDNDNIIYLPKTGDSDLFSDVTPGIHELTAYQETSTEWLPITHITIIVSERKDYFWVIRQCSTDQPS